ncbi:hypothetical protein SUDANB70_04040 [Streptomyces sp. enrichment culture]
MRNVPGGDQPVHAQCGRALGVAHGVGHQGRVPKLDTAVRDAPHGTGFIDSEAQLGVFRAVFRRVKDVSLDPSRSRDFIQRLAKEL